VREWGKSEGTLYTLFFQMPDFNEPTQKHETVLLVRDEETARKILQAVHISHYFEGWNRGEPHTDTEQYLRATTLTLSDLEALLVRP